MLDRHPSISIVIPTYNGDPYLAECLESVICQSYPDFEIVMSDNCSTDHTLEIIQAYQARDQRIRRYQNEENIGLVGNLNRCVERASGTWIKFVCQDDLLAPECLEVMRRYATADAGLIVSARTVLIQDGVDADTRAFYTMHLKTIGHIFPQTTTITPAQFCPIAAQDLLVNLIGEPSNVLFRKDAIETIGLFDRSFMQSCDHEFWLRYVSHWGLTYIAEPLASFRVHPHSMSAENATQRLFYKKRIEPVLLLVKCLYDPIYHNFRANLPELESLKNHLQLRLHKLEREMANNVEHYTIYQQIVKRYPLIEELRQSQQRSDAFLRRLLRRIKRLFGK